MSLIDLLNTRLDVVKSAGPLAVMFAAQDFAETAAAIIRDHETRLAALERLHRTPRPAHTGHILEEPRDADIDL